ncbi:oligopeptide/dipeptide ABC transporter ATP-binding protein [Geomicrobium sp. JCM 19055]|uniref:oligopeptide/dipeptide ABC transporter ATP-binding protein n=1 Tax=Geomicrobium sp. JCM 19055 TaxID=1460649 RepID=UPI00045ED5A0|nr:oligopeptide/dipeptide ABC transporter ATP-binding protein [Geomicrobium sp. JCM 19055]GAJ97369.1 oligopeptide transport ATP-binding protein OppF [Geomicrobium sp. JCM 19055]
MSHVIKVKGVKKHFKPRKKQGEKYDRKSFVKSVDGVNFTVNEGEVLGIIGESGCGKSTLAKLLVNLETPTSGDITIQGKPIQQLYKEDQKAFRRRAQMIFQNPFDTFDPRYTIAKVLERAMKIHNIGSGKDERRKMSVQLLDQAGLNPPEVFLNRYPHELSGGQLQRVSIIRSMLLNPDFIVADEPVSMLDVSVRAEIMNILVDICQQSNKAMVFISHDIQATHYIADRIAVMYLGRFIEEGPANEILHNPKHPYTRALISNSPAIEISNMNEAITLSGDPPSPINTGPGCYFYNRCYMRRDSCQHEYPEKRVVSEHHVVYCPYTVEQKKGGVSLKKVALGTALGMLLAGGVLAGCNPASSEGVEAVIVGADGDPQTYNPNSRSDDFMYPVAQNVFNRLVKLNNNQEIIPDLARNGKYLKMDYCIPFTYMMMSPGMTVNLFQQKM